MRIFKISIMVLACNAFAIYLAVEALAHWLTR